MSERVKRSVAVVSAGLGQPSATKLLADRLAQATARELEGRGVEASIAHVELREHAHAIVDAMLAGFPSGELARAIEQVTSADGLIAVTPIYTTAYSGLFKSFIDILDPQALAGQPVLLAATGGSARHSLALDYAIRPLFTYLHADPVTTSVYAATDDWAGPDAAAATSQYDAAGLPVRIGRAARELAAVVANREPRGSRDEFDIPSFAELLRRD